MNPVELFALEAIVAGLVYFDNLVEAQFAELFEVGVEVGNVLINGAKVVTINSESTEIEDIKKTIADCGLEGVENINYLQAIKRVIGMSDKPRANE